MYKNMFLYEITHRYLENDYQFFDTLKTKHCKIRGNYNLSIEVKFHKLEWSSPLNNRNLLFLIGITFASPDLYGYVEYFVNSWEIIFGGELLSKSDDSKYCNFLNSKLCHAYISAGFAKFSEHSCLYNHLQE